MNNRSAILLGIALTMLLSGASAAPPKSKKVPLGVPAIQNAERVTGKKLSTAQKAAIMKAARTREDNIRKAHQAEWKKFRALVAKTVGLSLAQMEAKEKATYAKNKGKAKR